MPDVAEVTTSDLNDPADLSDRADLNDRVGETGPQSEPPLDPVAQKHGYLAVKVTANGRTQRLWQDICAGVVVGLVDPNGLSVIPQGVVETTVIDGILLDSPGLKGVTP